MAKSARTATWLVGDIGGTNARFGLMSPDGKLLHSQVLADADYPGIAEAIDAYLAGRGGLPRPRPGAIAIASPITGDEVRMTNHSVGLLDLRAAVAARVRRGSRSSTISPRRRWRCRISAIATRAGRRRSAVAAAGRSRCPRARLGPRRIRPVPAAGKWIPLTAAGHATMAPSDDREAPCSSHLRGQFDRRTGRAMHTLRPRVRQILYQALTAVGRRAAAQSRPPDHRCGNRGRRSPLRTRRPDVLRDARRRGRDLALTFGAQGGVCLAGGIVPRLGSRKPPVRPVPRPLKAKGGLGSYLGGDPDRRGHASARRFCRLRRGAQRVAARRRRSFIALPSPVSGIGITAIPSELRPVEPAQHREQIGRRLFEVAVGATRQVSSTPRPRAPKASSASPGRAALSLRAVPGGPAHSGSRSCPGERGAAELGGRIAAWRAAPRASFSASSVTPPGRSRAGVSHPSGREPSISR